jgi:Flp pilus assembly protein TadG
VNRRCRGEAGDAVTETVILVPVLLLLIMVVIQFGLWYHAEHVVQAAAQEGVRAARAEGSTSDAGRERAEQFLASVGGSVIDGPQVESTRDGRQASVVVTGKAVAVIPGVHLDVRAHATSPTEDFEADR